MKATPHPASPLRREDLDLLDYLIAKAIESCVETRRATGREQRDRKMASAA